jgi:hypothetical protein
MTKRFWWIAGGVAVALVVVAALTLVPVRSAAATSTPVSGRALVEWTAIDDCPFEVVTAELASREVTPVVNIFGLSQLRDLELSDIAMEAGLDDSCPEPTVDWRTVTGVSPFFAIGQPACGDDLWAVYASAWEEMGWGVEGTGGIQTTCGGDVVLWDSGQLHPSLTWDESFEGERFAMSSTGLIAADTWCLEFQPNLTLELQSGTQSGISPEEITNDFCLALGA